MYADGSRPPLDNCLARIVTVGIPEESGVPHVKPAQLVALAPAEVWAMFEQDVVGESPGNVKDVEQGLSSELSSGDVGAKDVEQNLYSVLDFVKHVSRLAIYRSYENSAAYTKHLVANAVKADLASMGVDRAHPLEYEEVCLEVCGVKLVARPVETSTSAKLRVLAIAPPASEHVKKYLKDVPASWEKALQNSAVPLKEIDAKKYQRWIRNSRLKKAGCATGVATAVVSTGAAGFFFWHWLTSILPDGPELSL